MTTESKVAGQAPEFPTGRTNVDLVFAIVADLGHHLAEVDLDQIDGEFFFRTIPEFSADIAEARGRLHGWDDPDARDPRWAVLERLEKRYGLTQPGVFEHALLGERLRMRRPEVVAHYTLDPALEKLLYDVLKVEVRSGSWRGTDLADCVQRWAAPRDMFLPRRRNNDIVAAGMSFDYHEAQSVAGPEGVVHHPAHVAAFIALPPPPPESIAVTFDASVRKGRQWHLLLPPLATRMDPLVRVRTWSIGLLMGAGWSFDDAWHEVAEILNAPEAALSQERDRQCRQQLIRDVPEARDRLLAHSRAR